MRFQNWLCWMFAVVLAFWTAWYMVGSAQASQSFDGGGVEPTATSLPQPTATNPPPTGTPDLYPAILPPSTDKDTTQQQVVATQASGEQPAGSMITGPAVALFLGIIAVGIVGVLIYRRAK